MRNIPQVSNNGLLSAAQSLADLPLTIVRGVELRDKRADAEEARQLRRSEAAQRKQIGEFKLAQMGRADQLATSTQDARERAMQEQLRAQALTQKKTGDSILRNDSYQALQNFFDGAEHGDATRSINSFLSSNKDDPRVGSIFGHPTKGKPVRVDALDLSTVEQVQEYLQSLEGVNPEKLAAMDKADGSEDGEFDVEAIRKRFTRITYADGTTDIADMVAIASKSGYTRWANAARRQELVQLSKIERKPIGSRLTAMQKNAAATAQAQTRIDSGSGTAGDRELVKFAEHHKGGTAVGKLTIAQDANDEWDSLGFQDIDVQELHKSSKARQLVERIETGLGMSSSDKVALRELSEVTSLAPLAVGMTKSQTGKWDKFVANASEFLSDKSHNAEAKMAYQALMNKVQNTLYGATLTDGEIALFKQAYGNIDHGHGKVLSGLSVALTQTRAKLETILSFNNPAVVKFRTGKSVEELTAAMDVLDVKIALFDDVAAGRVTMDEGVAKIQAVQQSTVSEEQEAINLIFGGQ